MSRPLLSINLGLVLLLCSASAAAQRAPYIVGSATAAPGQRGNGYLDVPAGLDAATRIPVIVINGAKPGPVLALVSGVHGTEYASIIALEKLIPAIEPAQLSGTVVLLPLVNVPSFLQKVPHFNPVDNKSMNRFYPGKADGTQTERASFLITREVVDRCDYLIDYHGGDLDESLRPYAYWGPTGKAEQDRISKEMVLAFGLDHIIIWRERPTDPAATRYLDNTASVHGKPSIVVEAGHAGTIETDDIALLTNGTLSTMRALKMLPGDSHPIENPVWGKVILEPRAPESGVILHVNAVPSLKKGDNIANIGVVAAHAP
jgi:uncharacterized protein